MLAIIGGTGLYELPGLAIAERLSTDTPFGAPSGDILRGRLHAHDVLLSDAQRVWLSVLRA